MTIDPVLPPGPGLDAPVVPQAPVAVADPRTVEIPVVDDRDSRYVNRELSWLMFNARVLQLAADADVPLLERLKFCAIFSSNLDEFFQVRVAGLKDQEAAGLTTTTPDGRTPGEQLVAIRDEVAALVDRQSALFTDELRPALAAAGVEICAWSELTDAERAALTDLFETRIFPVLTPLAVDPGHPFPYISDLSLNLVVDLVDPETRESRIARVKVPPNLDRFVALPGSNRYVLISEVMAAHLPRLFPGLVVRSHHVFRVTRNADLTLEEEEAEDLLEAVEMELRRRRFGRAIRLEVRPDIDPSVFDLLVRELDLDEVDVHRVAAPLDLTCLWELAGLDRPDLTLPVFSPVTEPELTDGDEPADLFAVLRRRDVLLHHPYSSFTTSVSEFIHQAAVDPHVLAIKMTLYRTSGDSPIIESLVKAAETGKQVAVLIELKARFDEAANITWARRLEQAGVHVAYGIVGLKIHCKTVMVIRDEPDGIRRYCHIGTGNYNPKTARIYEDLGLLTADPVVGADLARLFNSLTGYGRDLAFQRLLVAPRTLRPGLAELIRREMAAERGRIVLKTNSLVDTDMIDLLYEASQAGVQIDLVVRGICCLRPGVPGLSENIRVRSLVGRYLEHSRIYFFANGAGPGEPVYYIGSADLMYRNLSRRVEALVSIRERRLQARLAEILDVCLSDERLAWTFEPDGVWRRHQREGGLDAHVRLAEIAHARARGAEGVDAASSPDPVAPADVRAGGGVVIRTGAAGPEVLIVHRPRYDDWSLPKGKAYEGESVEDAARREVFEETGLRCELDRELPSVRYLDRQGLTKLVRYWLMWPVEGSFVPNDEVDAVQWVPVDDVRTLVTYDRDVAVVEAAAHTLG